MTDNLTLTLGTLKGRGEALKQARGLMDTALAGLSTLQSTLNRDLRDTVAALQGSDSVGIYSSVDQLLRLERFAGKEASVDYVKANPECGEAEATAAWEAAGIAATHLPALVVPAENYAALYRANLTAMGLTPDATYESQRAWIIATPKSVIMGS